MRVSLARLALMATIAASLAACGSQTDAAPPPAASPIAATQSGSGNQPVPAPAPAPQPAPGISPESTSIPIPFNASNATPGAVQPATSCGIYLRKPDWQQWIAEVKADAGKDYDSLPPQSQNFETKAQFIDNIVSPLTDASLYGVSPANIYDEAPADKITDYGKAYCEAEKLPRTQLDMMPAVRANPSENVIWGLNLCAQWNVKVWPAKNVTELRFQQVIHDSLCPQVYANPYIGEEPGGS